MNGNSADTSDRDLAWDLPLGFDPVNPTLQAQRAEESGIDGIWSSEVGHDPYLPLVEVARATSRIVLGTSIAVAFARSPLVHAQVAWDLQRLAPDRFILGLGSQVKTHNERRYSVEGSHPAERMLDLIRAIKAIWRCWQYGEKLDYHGQFYSHTLMTPFFTPPPLGCSFPRIFIAAVNERMLEVAGSECDGVHLHPLHTEGYITGTILPILANATRNAGRKEEDIEVCATVMIATGKTNADVEKEREALRAQVAFYASTPSYRGVLSGEGEEDCADKLSFLARSGKWSEMPGCIGDKLLDKVCVAGTWDEIAKGIVKRYRGRIHRLIPYSADEGTPWGDIASEVRSRLK